MDIEEVRKAIDEEKVTVVVAVASWKKSCKILTEELAKEIFDEDVKVIVLCVDDGEEQEEAALELNMSDILPCVHVYRVGKLVNELAGDSVCVSSIKAEVHRAKTNQTGGCCQSDDIRQGIAASYAATVNGSASCCVSIDSTMNGYSLQDLEVAGAKANLGLGCGNPLSFAALQEGEDVVDLGSGAGIDCFIAGQRVGPTGSVIGVDMTPDMVFQARSNLKHQKMNHVSFRLGEIEHLPVADNSVDVVISNCVVNLSPDKQQVMKDIFRILRPGGRVAICDVVLRENASLPSHLISAQALACWVSGAPEISGISNYLSGAGFVNVVVDVKDESREVIKQWIPGSGAEDFIVSANVSALKPLC